MTPILLLSDDLLFTSRIVGTGRDLGIPVKTARHVDLLETMARQEPPRLIVVDLANPGLSVPELIRRLRTVCPTMPYLVAYGSHVDAEGLKAARQAGCDLVLPRSAFVEQLPKELPTWLGSALT